ncbi:DHYS [Hepatospora eriocheir]|uniref:deoxyhypusine synthase n=1 Tax=Hepatospora eriocheir TaxID=1081669 RepID=A0A1X0Q6Y6_9MICR|nr:DHYS [Hepatospora eriocheir]
MRKANAKVFFGATSNITSCGLREVVCYMAKNKYFDVYVTPGGGIEEDIIKCFKPTKLGCFKLDGKELRENGWNRIGNLVINNENYVYYEQFIVELLNELIDGYTPENPRIITPSEFISLLGKKINNENSVLYWCYKNNINVYCPAITDGSTGDIITFFNKRDCLKIDIVQDIYNINCECMNLKR